MKVPAVLLRRLHRTEERELFWNYSCQDAKVWMQRDRRGDCWLRNSIILTLHPAPTMHKLLRRIEEPADKECTGKSARTEGSVTQNLVLAVARATKHMGWKQYCQNNKQEVFVSIFAFFSSFIIPDGLFTCFTCSSVLPLEGSVPQAAFVAAFSVLQ